MERKITFDWNKGLTAFCFGAGGLCILYFFILVIFVGLSTKFNCVWLLAGVGLLLFGLLLVKNKIRLSKGARKAVTFVVAVCMIVFLNIEGLIVSGFFEKGEENLDYVIVLGAQMKENGPSSTLKSRLDRAIDYLEENQDTQVIVSGGQGSDEMISEAEGMKNYLVQNGIAEERILMEDNSVNTNQNLKFSSEYINIEEDTVGIVTSNFHIYRSVKLAEKQGYENVCGIAAKSHNFLLPANMLREFACIVYYGVTGAI